MFKGCWNQRKDSQESGILPPNPSSHGEENNHTAAACGAGYIAGVQQTGTVAAAAITTVGWSQGITWSSPHSIILPAPPRDGP